MVVRMCADTLASGGPASYPWWQLGTCVRNGLSKQQALEALTTVPAKMLGLQDQIGSLQVGMLGNVQILSGDPMQATSWVDTVVLEGQVVYERSKDPRLQYLFEAAKQAAEPQAPPAPQEPKAPQATKAADNKKGEDQ